jgi:hypothetical protein
MAFLKSAAVTAAVVVVVLAIVNRVDALKKITGAA